MGPGSPLPIGALLSCLPDAVEVVDQLAGQFDPLDVQVFERGVVIDISGSALMAAACSGISILKEDVMWQLPKTLSARVGPTTVRVFRPAEN